MPDCKKGKFITNPNTRQKEIRAVSPLYAIFLFIWLFPLIFSLFCTVQPLWDSEQQNLKRMRAHTWATSAMCPLPSSFQSAPKLLFQVLTTPWAKTQQITFTFASWLPISFHKYRAPLGDERLEDKVSPHFGAFDVLPSEPPSRGSVPWQQELFPRPVGFSLQVLPAFPHLPQSHEKQPGGTSTLVLGVPALQELSTFSSSWRAAMAAFHSTWQLLPAITISAWVRVFFCSSSTSLILQYFCNQVSILSYPC